MWRFRSLAQLAELTGIKHAPLSEAQVIPQARQTIARTWARLFATSGEDGNGEGRVPDAPADVTGASAHLAGADGADNVADVAAVGIAANVDATANPGAPSPASAEARAASQAADSSGRPRDDIPPEVYRAVEERYGVLGITPEQLMNFIEVNLDIQDAKIQGATPRLDPDRYRRYKHTRDVLENGPESSEEEEAWLDRNLRADVVNQPWPTTMRRRWIQEDTGRHLGRFKKSLATTYDQGWMTEALFPFDSLEEVVEKISGCPDVSSGESMMYWPDEDDGEHITRVPRLVPGATPMLDWANLAQLAAAGALSVESDAAPSGADGEGRQLDAAVGGGGDGDESGKAAASLGESESVDVPAASGAAGVTSGASTEKGGRADGAATVAGVSDDTAAVEGQEESDEEGDGVGLWAGLEHLEDGSEIPDELLQEQAEQDANEACLAAMYEEQAASYLRRAGYGEDEQSRFQADWGVSDADFRAIIEAEMSQQIAAYADPKVEVRSPEQIMEDLIPAKSRVNFFHGPLYDLRAHLEGQPGGAFSEEHAIPQMFRKDLSNADPAMLRHFVEGLVGDAVNEGAVPEVCKWEQVAWLHTGPRNWHPGNKRIALTVHVRDVQSRYALSDAAVQHLIKLAGRRYNPANGVLRMACQRHRHREDNRRQALHWLLKLVEAAHLKHPNPAWEEIKQQQLRFMELMFPAQVGDAGNMVSTV